MLMHFLDVESTFEKTNLLENWVNYKPSTSIEIGVHKFAKWCLNYYKS